MVRIMTAEKPKPQTSVCRQRDGVDTRACDFCRTVMVNDHWYGDFGKDGRPKAFCSPECRSSFCRMDNGIADQATGQVTLAKFDPVTEEAES